MPKTRFQSIIFTALMVFCIVYCMTVYNIALKFGGLNNLVFLLALKEMWLEYVVVFCLIYFVITNTAKKLAFRVIDPAKSQPIFLVLAIQNAYHPREIPHKLIKIQRNGTSRTNCRMAALTMLMIPFPRPDAK